MKSLICFLIVSFALLGTGCPKLVKTTPSTKFQQDELVSRINTYLANRQMAYYCAMTGNRVNYNFSEFSFVKVYSCGTPNTINGTVSEEDKIVAKRIRDEALDSGMAAVNSVYGEFLNDLNNGRSTANFVADIIDLGTSAAIGISNGERPLQIMGVALTAFRGGRKSADLNFFKEQSTPILINKMDDNRATVHSTILLKKKKNADEYTMAEAVRDIVDYYNAGTLVRAFTELSKTTAAQALESEKKVLQLQKIDPADIVTIDNVDANVAYVDLRKQYSAIFAASSNATEKEKASATESLKQIYRDIIKDADLADAVTLARKNNADLVADMDKLADKDTAKADAIQGPKIISIINKIYGSISLETGGDKVLKLVGHFNANPIK